MFFVRSNRTLPAISERQMDNIGIIIIAILYFGIGWYLASYWWWYEGLNEEYKKAKESGEGVEKGMVSIYLLFLVWLWPIKIVYEFIKKILSSF